ncbi:HD domain-containing protein [Chitinophaga rhizophila]|uniref:HD domain-containing protein n=1 Tax=Chitinophaga rhizophila TaxID=2866212 RepID=A0ABS7GIC1_9BACT|nr:HD domain-containing protein [Chitinophaga rhizophila]MBW8687443.1 HD domain-containing protein [Chitinophaga rhizophila]
MNLLTQIEDFARQAHGSQRRKFADEPYIHHPVRVMKICQEFTSALPVLSAALLHDVLEDTEVPRDQLSDFLHQVMPSADAIRTLELTIELTDIYIKRDFPQLNRRKRKQKEAERLSQISSEGQTVKYADIIDNANDILTADADFVPVFLHECRRLLHVMSAGDPVLRQRAQEIVEKQLAVHKRS